MGYFNSIRNVRANVACVFSVLALSVTAFAVNKPDARSSGTEAQSNTIDTATYRSATGRHKVLVENFDATSLKSASALRQHNYGSFQLLEVDKQTADRLIAQGRATNADFNNLLLLNTGAIDTTSVVANEASRKAFDASADRQLHLIQFPGPIKPEWMAQLEATGVRIVSPIPSNAYLVYGERSALSNLPALVAAGTAQWHGAYLGEYKIQPSVTQSLRKGEAKSLRAAPLAYTNNLFEIQLVRDASANRVTEAQIGLLSGKETPRSRYEILNYVNLVVELPELLVSEIAKRPDVVSIARYVEPQRMDESQNMILAGSLSGAGPVVPNPGNYLTTLANWGFTQSQFNASGLLVDVADDGADRNPTGADPGTIPQDANVGPVSSRHFVLYESGSLSGTSRYRYKGRWGTGSVTDGGLGRSGHGQLNMSIVGGYVPDSLSGAIHRDAQGFRYGLGVAPFVRLGNSVIFDPNFTSPNLPNMLSAAYASGARISSNSWGANSAGAYTVNSQAYDALVRDSQTGAGGNQPMLIVFSAGNAGPGAGTIGAPGTGKNLIAVGAAESTRSHAGAAGGVSGDTIGADGCGSPDADANSASDMAPFSSRGPTADGRVKPDIVAPGTHITGMSFVALNSDPLAAAPGNLGTADATFRGDGVCGMPGGGTVGSANNFFPLNPAQRWYTTSSGTSHSAPAVAGGAALLYQQFINNPNYIGSNRTPSGSAPPSPALVKAYLANSSRYLNGVGANDSLPSNNQGMGSMNLGMAFDGVRRIIRDQAAADTFTASGQVRTYFATVDSASAPLRVTLAYTDAPGPTSGNAYINNLDLRVYINGTTYLGNVFSGANSVSGGAADVRNNLESVFLPAGLAAGTVIAVQVRATNIAGQGDPALAGNNQDFALVVYNALPSVDQALLAFNGAAIPTGNSVVEPNECNDINVTLANEGTLGATAIGATLSSTTPGVTVMQDNSAYASLAAAATGTNATTYKVSTSPAVACGSTIDFKHTVTYTGGASPTVFNFSRLVGQPPAANYAFASTTGATISSTGALVPMSADDDRVLPFLVPFDFSVYGTNVVSGSTIKLSSNGQIRIEAAGSTNSAVTNTALPSGTTGIPTAVPTLFPYWDDLDMSSSVTTGGGIYTEVTGIAPTRTLKIEWRARNYVNGQTLGAPNTNFAVYFHENSEAFEYVYASVGAGAFTGGASATIGIQAASTGTTFTQFSFNTASVSAGQKLSATRAAGVCTSGASACAPSCSLDINGDASVSADKDGVLLLRYLLGFRDAGLVSGIPLTPARPDAAAVATFIGNAANYDVFRRTVLAPNPMRDAMVLLRLMLGSADAALLSGISTPADASYGTPATIRANVNARCGTSF